MSLAVAFRHQTPVQAGIAPAQPVAQAHQLLLADQPRIGVLTHAARIVVDDVPDAGAALGDLEDLVDLLLVLAHHQLHLGVVDQVLDLLVERILINAEAHRAQRVGGDLALHPFRAVAADDGDHVAAAHAERAHPERHALDRALVVAPGELPPDAEFLFPQRHFVGPALGVVRQQLGKGVVPGDIGVVDVLDSHHATACSCPSTPSPR